MEPTPVSENRYLYAVVVAVLGLLIPAVLIALLTYAGSGTSWTAAEITSIAGLFTSVVGTLVGAFLGVQVGSAGKRQAEARAAEAESRSLRAAAMLEPERAAEFLAR